MTELEEKINLIEILISEVQVLAEQDKTEVYIYFDSAEGYRDPMKYLPKELSSSGKTWYGYWTSSSFDC